MISKILIYNAMIKKEMYRINPSNIRRLEDYFYILNNELLKGGTIVDVKDLADEKRALGVRICQEMNDFEAKTRMEVTGMRIVRRDSLGESVPMIEGVIINVRVPD